MENKKFCAFCGAELKADAQFCAKCGAKQPEKAAAPAAPQTQAETPTASSFGNNNNGGAYGSNNNSGAFGGSAPAPAVSADSGKTEVTAGMDPDRLKKILPIAGIAILVLAVVIAVVCIIVNVTKYTTIDAQELFRLKTSGLNGSGKAVGAFAVDPEIIYAIGDADDYKDTDAFVKMLLSGSDADYEEAYDTYDELDDEAKEKYKDIKSSDYLSFDEKEVAKAFEKADSKRDAADMRDVILEEVRFDLSKEKDLKNGDKIKVEVDYDEDELKDNNIKLKNTEFEVEVKGLLEAEALDVFDGIKVTFEGTSGSGEADYNTSEANEFVRDNFSFYLDSVYGLSNGDKITLEVEYHGYMSYDEDNKGVMTSDGEHFYTFEKDSTKEFTVEGLKELEAVDISQYVELEYSGTYPDLYIDWEFKEDTPDYVKDNVYIYLDYEDDDLVEGGKITLEADAYSSFADAGYKLSAETYEVDFDMNKVEKYITASDITKDTYASEMDAYAKDKANSFVSSYPEYDFGIVDSITSVDLARVYVRINKDQEDWWNAKNQLIRVYSVTCQRTRDDKQSQGKFYIITYTNNVVVSGDGNTFAELDEYDLSSTTMTDGKEVIAEYGTSNDVYDVTEIKVK